MLGVQKRLFTVILILLEGGNNLYTMRTQINVKLLIVPYTTRSVSVAIPWNV